jgi:hypothetical protein
MLNKKQIVLIVLSIVVFAIGMFFILKKASSNEEKTVEAKTKVKLYFHPVDSDQWDKAAIHRTSSKGFWYYKSANLRSFLRRFFPNAKIILLDGQYAVPDKRWCKNTFFPAVHKYMNKNHPYSNKFDCDKISSYVVHLAVLAYNKAPQSPDCDGMAIGEIYYETEKGTGHAANIVIFADEGVGIFDAGNGEWLGMTIKEQGNTWVIKF